MNKIFYVFIAFLIITSCTEDEGVKFQPDSFYLNASTTSANENRENTENPILDKKNPDHIHVSPKP